MSETKDKEKFNIKDLLETIAREDNKHLLWLILGSLISADTLVDADSCLKSSLMLKELKNVIQEISGDLYTQEEKDEVIKFCNDGLNICQRDLENFKANEKQEIGA